MIRHCWCAAAAAAGARNYVCVSIIGMRVIELFSTSNQCVCVLFAKRVARTRINQSNRKLKLRHYSEQRTRDINVFECDTNSHSTIVFVRFNPKSINSIGSRNAIPSISPFSSFEHRFLSVRSFSANFFFHDEQHFIDFSYFTFRRHRIHLSRYFPCDSFHTHYYMVYRSISSISICFLWKVVQRLWTFYMWPIESIRVFRGKRNVEMCVTQIDVPHPLSKLNRKVIPCALRTMAIGSR